MGEATWLQAITTGGAIVVLTWLVLQLTSKDGKLSPRREVEREREIGEGYKEQSDLISVALRELTAAVNKQQARRRRADEE